MKPFIYHIFFIVFYLTGALCSKKFEVINLFNSLVRNSMTFPKLCKVLTNSITFQGPWNLFFKFQNFSRIPWPAGTLSIRDTLASDWISAVELAWNNLKITIFRLEKKELVQILDYANILNIKSCIGRESNPGRPRGRRAFYHWTTDAHLSFLS